MLRTLSSFALALWVLPAGCAVFGTCGDDVGCASELRIELRPKSGSMPTGVYTLTVVADARSLTNTCTLLRGSSSCQHADAELQSNNDGSITVWLLGTPTHVSISVEYERTPFAQGAWEPTYATSRPNGEDCEPVCHGATVTLDVDAPNAVPPPTRDAGGD